MARNVYIRPEHVIQICKIVHDWSEPKITWNELCEASTGVLGYVPSRSGLSAHADIQSAFQSRKSGLKSQSPEPLPYPSSRTAAARTIKSRDVEIASLKQQIKELLDRFWRWQYNAALRGVTPENLDDRTHDIVIDRVMVSQRLPGSR